MGSWAFLLLLLCVRLCEGSIALPPAWDYAAWSRLTRKVAHSGNEEAARTYLRAVEDALDSGGRPLLKSYSFWAHHRAVADRWRVVADNDDALTRRCLRIDAKNLLTYDHRRWLLRRSVVSLGDELRLTEALIQEDPGNNAAWSHRFACLRSQWRRAENLHDALGNIQRLMYEMHLVIGALGRDPCNEAAWRYLIGLSTTSKSPSLRSRSEQAAYEATYSSQIGRHLLRELRTLHDRAKDSSGGGLAPALEAAISEALRKLQ